MARSLRRGASALYQRATRCMRRSSLISSQGFVPGRVGIVRQYVVSETSVRSARRRTDILLVNAGKTSRSATGASHSGAPLRRRRASARRNPSANRRVVQVRVVHDASHSLRDDRERSDSIGWHGRGRRSLHRRQESSVQQQSEVAQDREDRRRRDEGARRSRSPTSLPTLPRPVSRRCCDRT